MKLKKLSLILAAFVLPFALMSCSDDSIPTIELPDEGNGNGDVQVTFIADMSELDDFDPDEHTVYITGSHLDWPEPGTEEEVQRMEPDEDDPMLYVITYTDIEDGEYDFKFFSDAIGSGWDGGEWEGGPDRSVVVDGDTIYEGIFGVEPED